jgi:hypothetical protein
MGLSKLDLFQELGADGDVFYRGAADGSVVEGI